MNVLTFFTFVLCQRIRRKNLNKHLKKKPTRLNFISARQHSQQTYINNYYSFFPDYYILVLAWRQVGLVILALN